MTAAHELIERGFEVIVLERRDIAGGKARSIPVADTGQGTRAYEVADKGISSLYDKIPGEHGFRFFPGFYKHVIDTMRRIPSFDGRKVADHLVPTTRVGITQYGMPMFRIPTRFPKNPPDAGGFLRAVLLSFGPIVDISPEEFGFFGARLSFNIGHYAIIAHHPLVRPEPRGHPCAVGASFTRRMLCA